MPKLTSIALAAALFGAPSAATSPPEPVTLVICAPGYPGSTAEAQPSMDTLAAAVSRAAGWPAGTVRAEYQETEEGGLARFRTGATIALVPLPFYLAHGRELRLTPRAQAVQRDAQGAEVWTLVAKKGRVEGPSALSGWRIVSLASYAPDFIRNVALERWGPLPGDVTFVSSGQVLSALRKAASGENVAVLLDGSQTAALSTLPFAGELEMIASSPPLPSSVLSIVGSALPAMDVERLTSGLLKMQESPEGSAALAGVRLSRFVPVDEKALASASKSYAAAK